MADKTFRKNALATMIAVSSMMLAGMAHADYKAVDEQEKATAEQILSDVYGKPDAKGCHMTTVEATGQWADGSYNYCMMPQHTYAFDDATGQKTYTLFAAGDVVDKDGDHLASHFVPGLAGLFYYTKTENGGYRMLTQLPQEPYGHYGKPNEGELVEMGPNNTYGWQLDEGDIHMGLAYGGVHLFAPVNGKLTKLGFIQTSLDNTGYHGDKKGSDLEGVMTYTKTGDSPIYPIQVRVKGKKAGKRIKPQTFSIPFDEAKGSYQEPAAYTKLMSNEQ